MSGDEKPVILTEAALKALVGEKTKNFKLPTFWPSRPKAWFLRIESEFSHRKVTSQLDKYHAVLSALEDDHIDEIGTSLSESTDSSTAYDDIKTALLEAFGESQGDAFTYIFGNNLPPYDYELRPSQFMNQLLKRADDHLKKSETLKIAFIRRLPASISTIAANLAPSFTNLMEFARKCDDLFEIEKSKSSKPINHVKVDENAECASGYEAEEDGEQIQVNAVRGQFRGRRGVYRGSFRGNPGRGSRGRGNGRTPNKICVYHSKWGEEALKCVMPCSWPNNKFK